MSGNAPTREGSQGGDPYALHTPTAVRALLARHGLRPDKSFGQNFLVDQNTLLSVVSSAGIEPDDTVFEVGPGLGVLTRQLAMRARTVVAVEKDERLRPVLAQTTGEFQNVRLQFGDALRFPLETLPQGSLLVANLPYNVATTLLVDALQSGRFRRLVAMVQREVAQRLSAGPDEEAYGALSLIANHFSSPRIVRLVAPGNFFPAPEVTSAIIRLDVRPDARPSEALFTLVKDAFRHRRKTLVNNLQSAGWKRPQVEEALEALGLDRRIRAESLNLETFEKLLEALSASDI